MLQLDKIKSSLKLDKFASKINSNLFKSKFSNKKINSFFSFCNTSCQKSTVVFNKWLQKFAKLFVKCHISANFITVFGFIIGLLAINFLAIGHFGSALVCILLNRFCDILDGAVAKVNKPTDFGIFLDASLDYMFYAGVIFGFALANPEQNAVAATFLMFGFISSACALLAYAIVAYKSQNKAHPNFNESPFYLGGIAQGFETFITLSVLCLVPRLFMPLAVILGIFCFIKAVSVIISAYYVLVISGKKSKE
ncbi:MAG: CDP-alcohol phosphatidyltransferase family protein [Alphaproteobacteria bacterium]|nr:CDP-alcohol phosphatidyltransferase family protein [Alphaproteobacteria bacterium]